MNTPFGLPHDSRPNKVLRSIGYRWFSWDHPNNIHPLPIEFKPRNVLYRVSGPHTIKGMVSYHSLFTFMTRAEVKPTAGEAIECILIEALENDKPVVSLSYGRLAEQTNPIDIYSYPAIGLRLGEGRWNITTRQMTERSIYKKHKDALYRGRLKKPESIRQAQLLSHMLSHCASDYISPG